MDSGQVVKDLKELAGLFAQANHDAGLGNARGVEFFCVAEKLKRAFVARAGADNAIEARNGLRVVVEDLGAGFDDNANGFAAALKVWDQDLAAAAWGLAANLGNDQSKGARATDQIIVAIDAGNDGMLQAERSDSLSHAAGLVKVDGLGAAFGHGAEAASACAEIAQHHEGGSLVMPAFADVGALGALADGVQAEGTGQSLEVVVVFADRGAGLEPLRLGSRGLAGDGDLDQFHTILIVAGAETERRGGTARDCYTAG